MIASLKLTDADQVRNLSRQVSIVRWVIPLLLFGVVLIFETSEHIITNGNADYNFSREVILFGVIGPSVVFVVLSWIHSSLLKLARAYDEIHLLNVDLEHRIEARTRDLEKANDELRQLDRIKSEFVSLVSHEFRAPLTNIQGGLELALQEGKTKDENLIRVLSVVQAEVARLANLVCNILNVSALEMGHLPLRLGPVALRPLIAKSWQHCVLATHSSHCLDINIPAQLPPVWGDENRLTDIFTNLLSNAIKYSPADSQFSIDVTTEDHHIHLTLKDEGPGIPESEQSLIFEMFYRGQNISKNESTGYGLGLYFCRKFLEAQNGKVWASSASPSASGTVFHVLLPIDGDSNHNEDE